MASIFGGLLKTRAVVFQHVPSRYRGEVKSVRRMQAGNKKSRHIHYYANSHLLFVDPQAHPWVGLLAR